MNSKSTPVEGKKFSVVRDLLVPVVTGALSAAISSGIIAGYYERENTKWKTEFIDQYERRAVAYDECYKALNDCYDSMYYELDKYRDDIAHAKQLELDFAKFHKTVNHYNIFMEESIRANFSAIDYLFSVAGRGLWDENGQLYADYFDDINSARLESLDYLNPLQGSLLEFYNSKQ